MKTMNNEEWYDDEIAPQLMELAQKCQERGISFLALVNYGDELGHGFTLTQQEDASALFRVTSHAMGTWGNVDALINALREDGREHGHSSIYLQLLDFEER